MKNFYNKAKDKAEETLKAVYDENLNKDELRKKAVDYFYKNLPENEKNLFEYVAVLSKEMKKLLDAKTQTVKFSIESFTKNIINHPELLFQEYFLIPEIINKTELLIYVPKNGNEKEKIICFAENGKYYKIVIKSTGNKEENFLQSFHMTDLKRMRSEKNKKGVKVIFDKLT